MQEQQRHQHGLQERTRSTPPTSSCYNRTAAVTPTLAGANETGATSLPRGDDEGLSIQQMFASRPRPKQKSRRSPEQQQPVLSTPPPVRIRMTSVDILCMRSMEVEWENGSGERQSWSSWSDWLSTCYETEKLLPCTVTDIRVRFNVRTPGGPVNVCKVDRSRQGKSGFWLRGRDGQALVEEFWFRESEATLQQPIDIVFELKGPLLHCYVCRAWNAAQYTLGTTELQPSCSHQKEPSSAGRIKASNARIGNGLARESWEFWDGNVALPESAIHPAVLQVADKVAPHSAGAGNPMEYYTCTTARLVAAAKELQDIRRSSLQVLRSLDQLQTNQWVAVNSTNTLSAGLGIAAAVSMFVAPPAGIALGIGSAAVGGAAATGDTIGDRVALGELRGQIMKETWNSLAVAELEREWLQACDAATEALRAARGKDSTQQLTEAGLLGASVVSGLAGAGMAAKIVVDALEASSSSGTAAVVGAARLAPVMARVFGVASAALSTGVAVHGWSTTRSFQATLRERAETVESAILLTQRWLAGIGELECSICLCCIEGSDSVVRCHTWHYIHARCYQQWVQECRSHQREAVCPLCTGKVSEELQPLQDFLTDDIRNNIRTTKA